MSDMEIVFDIGSKALDAACRHLADNETCPHDLDGNPVDCERECRVGTDAAECWKRYFIHRGWEGK